MPEMHPRKKPMVSFRKLRLLKATAIKTSKKLANKPIKEINGRFQSCRKPDVHLQRRGAGL
jgi:hypothetical protein